MTIKKKLFLASSSELKEDRQEFEINICRKNKDWIDRGVFLELVLWEDFLDAVSQTRLQDEYNQAIRACDLFVMLFHTKVGQYTKEEFETAFGQFKSTNKPFIFTYFKHPGTKISSANADDMASLRAFQEKLRALGHFYTRYENIDALKLHFYQQLDKLVTNGFIEFKPTPGDAAATGGDTYQAYLTGNGAIAQGPEATAVGAGGVIVGDKHTGDINTGTQTRINAGGAYIGGNLTAGGDVVGRDKISHAVSPDDLTSLFAPLLSAIAQLNPPGKRGEALQQAEALKAEVAKDQDADDSKIAKIVDGLVTMVPGAIGHVVSLFANPVLNGVVGPVTNYVLAKLKGN